MKYTEQMLQAFTAPLSPTEDSRAKNAINMIRSAIESNRELRPLEYEVFLQGSYANNTNVKTESDVDVCVMLKSSFFYDLPDGKCETDYGITPEPITFQRYRDLVKKALIDKFGSYNVFDGNKSMKITENSYHVKADVVPTFQHRRYMPVGSGYIEGTRFYSKDGKIVTNYPKQHIKNGTEKNNQTNYDYKKLVRIMKHIKNDMVEDKITDGDTISSFLIECLVWNVPNSTIMGCNTWTETVKRAIIFLYNAIKDGNHKEWGEVSELLYLFRGHKWTDQDAKQWLADAWNYLGYNK